MAKFLIRVTDDGRYSFVLKAPNGKVILTSDRYEDLVSCEEGIYSAMEHSQYDWCFHRKADALRAETQKLEAVYKKKIDDLEELKKSILQKEFAGELRSGEPVEPKTEKRITSINLSRPVCSACTTSATEI